MSKANSPQPDDDFSWEQSEEKVEALLASLKYTFAQLRLLAKIRQEFRRRPLSTSVDPIPSTEEKTSLYTDIIFHNTRISQLVLGGGKAYVVPSFNIEPLYRINIRSMTHFELSKILSSSGQERIRQADFFPIAFVQMPKLPDSFSNAVLQVLVNQHKEQHEEELLDELKAYGMIPEDAAKDFIEARPELFIPSDVRAEYKGTFGKCYYNLLKDYTVSKDAFGYSYLFAIRLNQVPLSEIDNFLEYQLHHSAGDDLPRFFRFLDVCCHSHKDMLVDSIIQIVQGWKQYREKQPPQASIEDKLTEKEEESTLSRQVLLIYYLLLCNGVKLRNTTGITDVARFIHQVKGKKFTDAANSDIYKKLQLVPRIRKDPGGQIDDLNYIRPFFEKINLIQALELIDKEIHQIRMEKSQSK